MSHTDNLVRLLCNHAVVQEIRFLLQREISILGVGNDFQFYGIVNNILVENGAVRFETVLGDVLIVSAEKSYPPRWEMQLSQRNQLAGRIIRCDDKAKYAVYLNRSIMFNVAGVAPTPPPV